MLDAKEDTITVPPDFPKRDGLDWFNALSGTCWNWWLSPSSPVAEVRDLPEPGNRLNVLRYADWLKAGIPCGDKGVYLWLVPRPGASGGLRFIHVGMSTASMRDRTHHHCLEQIRCRELGEWCTADLIYKLPHDNNTYDDGFGSLGEPLWDGGWNGERKARHVSMQERFGAAKHFLEKLQILYLTPADNNQANARIKALEAIIAVAAAQLLDPSVTTGTKRGKETTNTLSGKMGSILHARLQPRELEVVAKWLNRIQPMLPETQRRTT